MAFPTTVDGLVDLTSTSHVSQVLGPQRITVGPTMVNVKSDLYGAVGNGVADDSTAITAAETAIEAIGGGILCFPPGTYIASALSGPDSNIHWLGSGEGATVLKLKNSTNTFLLQSKGFAGLTGTNGTGGPTNFSISKMSLDGNKANNGSAAVPVMRLYGYGFRLEDLRIFNGKNEGLYSEWSTSLPSPGNDSMIAFLSNIKVHDCDSHGVHWKGPHDSQWVKGEIFNNGARGIFVDAGGDGLTMESVHSWGLTQTYACYMAATGVGAVNCEFEGASTAQVAMDANDCFIDSGFIFGFGVISAPVGIEIGTTGSRSGLTIWGVKINNCTSGALKFVNDPGCKIAAQVFQASGTPTVGTINTLTEMLLLSSGVAGTVSRFAGQVEVHGGNALRLLASGDGSWADLSFNGSVVGCTWPLKPVVVAHTRQTPTEAVLVSGVSANLGDIVAVTLTAPRLVGAPLNPTVGQRLTFTLLQSGAGAFAVTWNAIFKLVWSDTGNATGKRSSISVVWDGTNWNQDGAQAPYV